MTPTESKLELRSIQVSGGPTITVQGLQKENVAVEEARQVLDEIDFSSGSKEKTEHTKTQNETETYHHYLSTQQSAVQGQEVEECVCVR